MVQFKTFSKRMWIQSGETDMQNWEINSFIVGSILLYYPISEGTSGGVMVSKLD